VPPAVRSGAEASCCRLSSPGSPTGTLPEGFATSTPAMQTTTGVAAQHSNYTASLRVEAA
jgi:hypothetical protein